MQRLRIATRQSQLALKQTHLVKEALEKHHSGLAIEIVPMVTTGDKTLEHTLAFQGGKGLFTKELEQALLEDRADIAVHSMKDMPVEITNGLEVPCFLEREDPRDVLVSTYPTLSDLPPNALVGTASFRRTCMLKHHRSDLAVKVLRGNVNTRLAKLDEGHFDAIILAAAGLHRLDLKNRIKHYFSIEESLPAIGQGIIGVQTRENDTAIKKLLSPINHANTALCLIAERALNKLLGGSCHAPIGGHATTDGTNIHLQACVYSHDGEKKLFAENKGNIKDIQKIAELTAKQLFEQGAKAFLS